MKKILFVISFLCLGGFVLAQEPVKQDTLVQQPKVYEHTTYDTVYQVNPTARVAVPQKAQEQQGVTVLEPETMVLKAGVENVVRVKLEKVGANNTILKVVNEDVCAMRKGGELGTYYLTPKVNEGTVTVRAGYMDFMGAYFKVADIDFTISAE
ncbi:MAG: hypothetical protein IJK84_08875 [Bacteroidales bacterium]|nr:hypothetical protein [Bacteroidales bacterium]